jgi:hypothetical protein
MIPASVHHREHILLLSLLLHFMVQDGPEHPVGNQHVSQGTRNIVLITTDVIVTIRQSNRAIYHTLGPATGLPAIWLTLPDKP